MTHRAANPHHAESPPPVCLPAMPDRSPISTERTAASGRVLCVIDRAAHARFGRALCELALALSSEEREVVVLTDDPALNSRLEGTATERVLVRAFRGWHARRLLPALNSKFERPPRAAHLWCLAGLETLSAWAHDNRTRVFVHASTPDEVDALLRRGVQPHEQVTAATEDLAARLRPNRSGAMVRVVWPAVLAPQHVADLAPRGRTLGLIWVGDFASRGGISLLLEAVGRLADREVDFHLVLLGQGGDARPVHREIVRLGIQSRVSLIGDPLIWDRAVGGADACIVPTRDPNATLAPLLAMGMGKLVIASRDQTADWFIDGQTCVCFEPGSAEQLAACVRRLVDGHPSYLAVARAASAYVRENHEVHRMAAQLVELERSAAGGARAAT